MRGFSMAHKQLYGYSKHGLIQNISSLSETYSVFESLRKNIAFCNNEWQKTLVMKLQNINH